jgi:hypothetical protein
MNELLKAIPVLFYQRKPVTMPDRVDLTALTINKTNRQFESAFIEVTGYGKKQERSNHAQ